MASILDSFTDEQLDQLTDEEFNKLEETVRAHEEPAWGKARQAAGNASRHIGGIVSRMNYDATQNPAPPSAPAPAPESPGFGEKFLGHLSQAPQQYGQLVDAAMPSVTVSEDGVRGANNSVRRFLGLNTLPARGEPTTTEYLAKAVANTPATLARFFVKDVPLGLGHMAKEGVNSVGRAIGEELGDSPESTPVSPGPRLMARETSVGRMSAPEVAPGIGSRAVNAAASGAGAAWDEAKNLAVAGVDDVMGLGFDVANQGIAKTLADDPGGVIGRVGLAAQMVKGARSNRLTNAINAKAPAALNPTLRAPSIQVNELARPGSPRRYRVGWQPEGPGEMTGNYDLRRPASASAPIVDDAAVAAEQAALERSILNPEAGAPRARPALTLDTYDADGHLIQRPPVGPEGAGPRRQGLPGNQLMMSQNRMSGQVRARGVAEGPMPAPTPIRGDAPTVRGMPVSDASVRAAGDQAAFETRLRMQDALEKPTFYRTTGSRVPDRMKLVSAPDVARVPSDTVVAGPSDVAPLSDTVAIGDLGDGIKSNADLAQARAQAWEDMRARKAADAQARAQGMDELRQASDLDEQVRRVREEAGRIVDRNRRVDEVARQNRAENQARIDAEAKAQQAADIEAFEEARRAENWAASERAAQQYDAADRFVQGQAQDRNRRVAELAAQTAGNVSGSLAARKLAYHADTFKPLPPPPKANFPWERGSLALNQPREPIPALEVTAPVMARPRVAPPVAPPEAPPVQAPEPYAPPVVEAPPEAPPARAKSSAPVINSETPQVFPEARNKSRASGSPKAAGKAAAKAPAKDRAKVLPKVAGSSPTRSSSGSRELEAEVRTIRLPRSARGKRKAKLRDEALMEDLLRVMREP